jgi:hypothetical protein
MTRHEAQDVDVVACSMLSKAITPREIVQDKRLCMSHIKALYRFGNRSGYVFTRAITPVVTQKSRPSTHKNDYDKLYSIYFKIFT